MTQMFVDPIRQPYFSPVFIPTLPSLALSDAERATISKLQMRAWRNRWQMELTDSYYRGMQIINDLGIAIPPELQTLRVIVGWPRIAVDPYVERLSADGFRLPGATDSDEGLEEIWLLNGMDAEQSLLYTDALAMRSGWITLGSPDEVGDVPKVCVESPMNMSASWDVRTAKPKELLQSYWLDDRRHAVLMLPDQSIYIGEDDNGIWQITDRDKHNFGMVPAVRLANQARSTQRDGASEITPELMSIVDAACRQLLNLDVAGQFYSVPQKLILGATESDFQAADGKTKTAWETYISSVLALERDADGNLPAVHQFTAYDPSVFTKVMDMYASQAAGILAATPQDLGLYTQGNPITAEAYQVSESRRDRRAVRKQTMYGRALIEAMQIAIRFQNGGDLPAKYLRMAVDWADVKLPNVAGTADALTKYMAQGAIPPTSDPVLKRAGFDAIERRQMAQDRDPAQTLLDEVGSSEEAKLIKVVAALTKDATPDPTVAPAAAVVPAV